MDVRFERCSRLHPLPLVGRDDIAQGDVRGGGSLSSQFVQDQVKLTVKVLVDVIVRDTDES